MQIPVLILQASRDEMPPDPISISRPHPNSPGIRYAPAKTGMAAMAQAAAARGHPALAAEYDRRAKRHTATKAPALVKKPSTGHPLASAHSPSFAKGFAAAEARFLSVVESEHFAGREAKACAFLQTSMPADEILALLAVEPKQGADDEAAAQAIIDAIRRGSDDQDGAQASAACTWKAAIADINNRNGAHA